MDHKHPPKQEEQYDGNEEYPIEKLPSRSSVHKSKNKKTRLKVRYPVVRLLALFFVLLPVSILGITFLNNDDTETHVPEKELSIVEELDYARKTEPEKSSENNKSEITSPDEQSEGTSNSEEEINNKIEQTKTEKENTATPKSKEEVKVEEKQKEQTEEKQEEKAKESKPSRTNKPKPPPTQEKSETYEIIYHKVKRNENLYRISLRYFNSRAGEEIIRKENKMINSNVYEGQVLRIPVKDKSK